MSASDVPQWKSFSELFSAAHRRDLDCASIAALLLRFAQTPAMAAKFAGIRRDWRWQENRSTWVEVGRNLRRQAIPGLAWIGLEKIDRDLTTYWTDDAEQPETVISIDWVAGTMEMIGHFELHGEEGSAWLSYRRVTFSAMHVEATLAEAILSPAPSAEPERLPPFSDEERAAWIRRRGRANGGADGAFEEFKALPRYDGTKLPEFREQCAAIWGPLKGRPKKA